ncbi:MAG: hypothetical protein AAFU84_22240, partial [Cyanobacteria bacterium J06633_23]
NFVTKGSPNQAVTSGDKDPNHFDPNYFSKGMKWELPDLARSEASYKMAGDNYNAAGRAIFNATDGGRLEIFPRKSLEEFITM